MTQIYLFIVMILGVASVNAQVINFPDANFKAALLAADTNNEDASNGSGQNLRIDTNNNNGEIELSGALAVLELQLVNKGISDLTGIAFFTNLRGLKC
jgi:hypothetical protein